MEINNEVLADAMKSALRVNFLSSSEGLKLYANAIYSAMMWGREIDRWKRILGGREFLFVKRDVKFLLFTSLFYFSTS